MVILVVIRISITAAYTSYRLTTSSFFLLIPRLSSSFIVLPERLARSFYATTLWTMNGIEPPWDKDSILETACALTGSWASTGSTGCCLVLLSMSDRTTIGDKRDIEKRYGATLAKYLSVYTETMKRSLTSGL